MGAVLDRQAESYFSPRCCDHLAPRKRGRGLPARAPRRADRSAAHAGVTTHRRPSMPDAKFTHGVFLFMLSSKVHMALQQHSAEHIFCNMNKHDTVGVWLRAFE